MATLSKSLWALWAEDEWAQIPVAAGVANLFTEEFWALGKSRLAADGVWAQWLRLYGMGPDGLRGLIGTFADVLPHVALYSAIEGADLVLVGSERPIEASPAPAERLMASDAVRAELAQTRIRDPPDLVALHVMDRDQVLAFAAGAPRVTDDNLRVEYAAPIWLHTDIALQNWEDLYEASEVPWGSIQDPLQWVDLADRYDHVDHPRRARMVRARLLRDLSADDPLRAEVEAALAPR